MQITVREGTATCLAPAELTAAGIRQMVEDVKKALDGRDDFSDVCVDLSATENIDSMGLTFLIGLYKTYSARGRKIRLTGYSGPILEIFKIMKFDELFELRQ